MHGAEAIEAELACHKSDPQPATLIACVDECTLRYSQVAENAHLNRCANTNPIHPSVAPIPKQVKDTPACVGRICAQIYPCMYFGGAH